MKLGFLAVLLVLVGVLVGVVGAQVAPRWTGEYYETVTDIEVPEPPAPPLPDGVALLRTMCDRVSGDRVYLLAHADASKPGGLAYVGVSTVSRGCLLTAASQTTSAGPAGITGRH